LPTLQIGIHDYAREGFQNYFKKKNWVQSKLQMFCNIHTYSLRPWNNQFLELS
jgi:hypothetical protein